MFLYLTNKKIFGELMQFAGVKLLPAVLLLLVSLLAGCQEGPAQRNTPSALAARGEGARIILAEMWFQFALGTAIFILVLAMLGYIVMRRRQAGVGAIPEVVMGQPPGGMQWIIWGGLVLPVVVLTAVIGVSLSSLRALNELSQNEELRIQIVGHQWWWEVYYPDEGIVTANQMAVPVGTPVLVEVYSADVIHSFWIPEVHHKIDLIPGQKNEIRLEADLPGVYRGVCAEFCGLQHALMHFLLVVMPSDRFDMWLEHERSPALPPPSPLAALGQEVFLSSNCVYCHQIRGTPAAGSVGPDLTHIGSRFTIGAGILPNNRGNMGGWISDPQHLKPGVYMPATELTGQQLQALLAYLDSLK